MNRKEKLLRTLRDRLKIVDEKILDHEPWDDQLEFDELIDEAKSIARMIKIVESESGDLY